MGTLYIRYSGIPVTSCFEGCIVTEPTLNFVYTSTSLTHYAVHMRRVFGAWLINLLRTWGEQRTPGAWKGHRRIGFSLCSRKKTTNFSMRTVCRWCSAGLQSHPHIRAFGSRTIRHTRVYEALLFVTTLSESPITISNSHYHKDLHTHEQMLHNLAIKALYLKKHVMLINWCFQCPVALLFSSLEEFWFWPPTATA